MKYFRSQKHTNQTLKYTLRNTTIELIAEEYALNVANVFNKIQ